MRPGTGRALGAALACIAFLAPAWTCAQVYTIAPELWDRPRSGPAVAAQPAVKQAVSAWLAHPGARLVVHHGPGQDAYAQAEELQTWLIALAIEGDRVLLRNDLQTSEAVRLEVLRD